MSENVEIKKMQEQVLEARKKLIIAKLKNMSSKDGYEIDPEEQLSQEELNILFSSGADGMKVIKKGIYHNFGETETHWSDVIDDIDIQAEARILKLAEDKFLVETSYIGDYYQSHLEDKYKVNESDIKLVEYPDKISTPYYLDDSFLLGRGEDLPIANLENIFELSKETETKPNYKLSRIDLEIEKLKLKADFEIAGERIDKIPYCNCGLEDPTYVAGSSLYDVNSSDDIKEKILENWDTFQHEDVFDVIATLMDIDNDELKLNLFKKYTSELHSIDPRLLTAIVMSLNDNNLRQEYIKEIDRICMNPDFIEDYPDVSDMRQELEVHGYNYTEEQCQKIIRDRNIAHIVSTLDDPDTIIGYYNGMTDIYAKEIVLDKIQRFPEYKSELSVDELQAVSNRIKEEVTQTQTQNFQDRTRIEEDIMSSLKNLKNARKEYEILNKETSIEDR